MKSFFLYTICLLFLFSCHSDNNITITPIDIELDYAPLDKMIYYVVSNYKQLSKEELLKVLEDYIQLNCSEREIKQYEYYILSFYKKTFGVNYRKYIVEKRYEQAETPIISEHKDKNIALICYKKLKQHDDMWEYYRILYDKDSIILVKTDTIQIK